MLNNNKNIANYDNELWQLINQENIRQEENISLIASENYVSQCIMQLQGSQLTNKYAEGYPKKRYYGGCKYVDIIEQLAINRAKELFNADYVNVQPHSGSQANFSVYTALLKPGDTIIGMKLDHGGHLTHGSSVNLSGKLYNVVSYGIDINGNINYDEIDELANKYKPKIIIGGFSAYSGICDWEKMRKISDSVDAYLMVDMSHVAGLIAAGIYPTPLPYAHVVTSTTHKTLGGPRGGMILAKGNNKELYRKLDAAVFPGTQGGPLMHIIAAKAAAFKEAMEPSFKNYQAQIIRNSKIMVDIFIKRGYKIISNNTHNHMFLINLENKKITGKEAEISLGHANIIVNKNRIPNDSKSPLITSGIRIGTPSVTRRGLKEVEICELSSWISNILDNIDDKLMIEKIRNNILDICNRFPVYI